MRRKTRYLLITIGFVFFLIAAPLIVLYVGGIGYDFNNNRYVKTGILEVKTNPKNATIFVNGKDIDSSPATIQYLNSGEYDIKIEKEGYFPWEKRLAVESGKVTWSYVGVDSLHLIKNNSEIKTFSSGVLDFALTKRGPIMLTSSAIIVSNGDNKESQNYSIGFEAKNFILSPSGQFALVRGANKTIIIDTTTGTKTDLSSKTHPLDSLSFATDSAILISANKTLSRLDWQTAKTTVLLSEVEAWTLFDQNLYYLKSDGEVLNLFITPFGRNQIQKLSSNLPLFKNSLLVVTKQKQIFVLGDGSCYQINDSLIKLASNINILKYDQGLDSLLISGEGEAYYYDFGGHEAKLITRTSNPFISPILRTDIGYMFVGVNGFVKAIELDARDHQNSYNLFASIDLTKILANDDTTLLYILNAGTLSRLEIR